MFKLFNQIGKYIRQIVTILLFASSAILIVYMLPRERKFDMDYSIGSPWKYDNLTANFSFSIYKTDAELQAEKDSLLKKHYPFFSFDATLSHVMISPLSDMISPLSIADNPSTIFFLVFL